MATKKQLKKRMAGVGRKIKALRLTRNMSIEDLSRMTSVSSVTISNIEKGVYSPKLSTVLEIAQALGTTITYLTEEAEGPLIFKIGGDEQRLTSTRGVVMQDFDPIIMDKRASVRILEMDEGVSTKPHDSFDGNEFLHVLSGSITAEIEDKVMELDAGESLYFHGSYHHVLTAKEKSRIFFISTFV